MAGCAAGLSISLHAKQRASVLVARTFRASGWPIMREGFEHARDAFYQPHDVFGCDTTATSLSTAFSKIIFGAVGESTVVLLERSVVGSDGACSFEDKVKAVQAAGASGAIIFDSVEEEGLLASAACLRGVLQDAPDLERALVLLAKPALPLATSTPMLRVLLIQT